MTDVVSDRVIVELEAKLDRYNANVVNAEQKFDRAMAGIQRSAGAAERFVSRAALAMSTAIGSIGLVALGAQAVQTALRFKRFEQGLAIATGSTQAATREMKFLREMADSLGLRYITLAENFTGLAAAARGTNLEGQRTRDIFEAITKAIVATGGSAEQVDGALLAIQQIISKGTVSAEELRGQLGERLPGAFQIAARAMGVTTAELGKLLEQGAIASDDFIPKFAAQLRKEMPEALETADASFQRFQTALDDIANSTASGFMKELGSATDDLTETLKDMQQSGALEAIGSFLGTVIRLGGEAAEVIGDLALAWKRLQIEGGIRIRQQIEDGWFTSPEEKAQARRERAMLEAERDRMGRPSGPVRPFSQSFQNSLDAFISNATDTGGGSTTTSKQSKAAAARAAREAARLAKEIERNQRAYEADLDASRREELQLRGQLTGDVRERARLEHEQITLAYETRDREIDNLLADKDIDKAKAERLRLENERLTSLRHAVVNRGLDEQLAELDVRALEDRRATLEADAELATTREARLAIEKSILDLMEQEERARLETAIAAGQVADAEQARANLASRQVSRRVGTDQRYESPLERYRRRNEATSTQDQVEELVGQELDYVRDGIRDSITKRLGIKDPLLSGIINMFIQKAIIGPITDALLSGIGGGGGVIGAISGFLGFAGGGSMMVGGRGGTDRNLLSLNGRPIANVSRGETLSVGNKTLGRSGGGATIVQQITIDARNSVTPEGFAQDILAISGQQAIHAAAGMGQTVIRGVPTRLAQFQRDGV